MRTAIVMMALGLWACQPQPQNSSAEIDALRARVSAIEKRQQETDEATLKNRKTQAAVAQPDPPKVTMTFQLVGRGAMDAAGTKYPSRQRCEAARQVMLQDSMDRAEQDRARTGAIMVTSPIISCIPL